MQHCCALAGGAAICVTQLLKEQPGHCDGSTESSVPHVPPRFIGRCPRWPYAEDVLVEARTPARVHAPRTAGKKASCASANSACPHGQVLWMLGTLAALSDESVSSLPLVPELVSRLLHARVVFSTKSAVGLLLGCTSLAVRQGVHS